MRSFKQALNLLKVKWKLSLAFGFVAMLFIFLARATPGVGAIVVSLVLLIFQEMSQRLLIEGRGLRQISFEGKELVSYLLVAVALFPTGALFGSALGLLESPQSFIVTAPLALLLMIVASYFYLVLSQSLRWHLETQQSLAKSIDALGVTSLKNFKAYGVVSFYTGLLVFISGITKGAGLIVVLPLIFFANYFLYTEKCNRITERAPR